MKEVCSLLNRAPKTRPLPNAPLLKTVNPKHAHPSIIGPRAPMASPPIPLPMLQIVDFAMSINNLICSLGFRRQRAVASVFRLDNDRISPQLYTAQW